MTALEGVSRTKVLDISPLSTLTKLEGLVLMKTKVHDITPLASLINLERLALEQTRVSNIEPLVSCKKKRKQR